jgi:Tfp pilus assembly PilM family ATPase
MSDRRKPTDRRETRDRRRNRRRKGDGRVFVIEITGSELRFAMMERSGSSNQPDQVAAWTSRWRDNAIALESPEGLVELTAALREAARRHNMFAADVRIVLSGAFCVTRTVRGSIDEVRSELQRLEQRSRMYLSLGPGEKVLVSHTRLLDARHAHALAAACNKATLETVQTAAEDSGLEIAVIEPALSALARAAHRLPSVPAEPYLLVNLAESTTEIAVCHEGQLLLDYRPGGVTSLADLPNLLSSHLARLNRHTARYVRGSAPSLRQVYICGDEGTVATAVKQFGRRTQFEVRQVRPADVQATWELRSDAASAATAPLLGSLLLSYLPPDECDAPNLMQHILEGRQEPLRPRLLRSFAPLAATLLIAAGLVALTSRQHHELTAMHAELDSLAVEAARATELRLRLSVNEAKLVQLKQVAEKLPPGLGGEGIRSLAACMPSDVWLNNLTVIDRSTARLQGLSYLEAGVYDFVRWLELAPGIDQVALKRTSAASSPSGPATSFELELVLAEFIDQATRVARHESFTKP